MSMIFKIIEKEMEGSRFGVKPEYANDAPSNDQKALAQALLRQLRKKRMSQIIWLLLTDLGREPLTRWRREMKVRREGRRRGRGSI